MQFQIENESSEYFKGGVVALKEEHFARLALDSRTLRRLWLAVRYSLFAVRCSLFAVRCFQQRYASHKMCFVGTSAAPWRPIRIGAAVHYHKGPH
jgi:hypothetical protein